MALNGVPSQDKGNEQYTAQLEKIIADLQRRLDNVEQYVGNQGRNRR